MAAHFALPLVWLFLTTGGPPTPAFEEAAMAVGVDFVHFNGMTGRLYTAEVVGPGVALFDYDNDGDLDIYLGQGREFEGDEDRAPVFARQAGKPAGDRMFRNDLVGVGVPNATGASPAGEPGLLFVDVTAELGLDAPGYNVGVATGDYDRDRRGPGSVGGEWLCRYLPEVPALRALRRRLGLSGAAPDACPG